MQNKSRPPLPSQREGTAGSPTVPARIVRALRAMALVAAAALPLGAAAQGYPTRPLRIVVPFPAGGIVDITARQVGQKLAETLGQPVTIDNRAGAGGSIGTDIVAKSPADGYTLLMAFDTHAVNPMIYKGLRYDTFKDFTPVSKVATMPLIFAGSPEFAARTLADVVKLSKASPGTVSYGSVGAGSSGHLAAEQFKILSGADLLHVPFKGGAPALTALMGNQVQLLVFGAGTAVQNVQSGKVTGLAVTGTRRSKALPMVPTAAEAGYPQLNSGAWMGILVPSGTPAAIVAQLQSAIAKAAKDPALVDSLAVQAVELEASSSAEFGSFIRAEHDKWKRLIEDANLDLRQ